VECLLGIAWSIGMPCRSPTSQGTNKHMSNPNHNRPLKRAVGTID
jgi:hypothetical protein